MTLTAGPTHALSGAGFVTVATPAALRVQLSGLPVGLGAQFSSPRTLYRAGHITPRTAFGSLPSIDLTHDDLLIPGLPIGDVTSVGYDLVDGASADLTELVAAELAPVLMPWDRALALVHLNVPFGTNGSLSETTALSYTVPAGRCFMLEYANAQLVRISAASVTNYSQAKINVNGATLIESIMSAPAVGTRENSILGGSALYLPAGTNVSGSYASTDTGGTIFGWVGIHGFVFDAL